MTATGATTRTSRSGVSARAHARPGNIRPHYALAFANSFPSFLVLRERHGRPDLRFQVGIPVPIDLALDTFGEAAFADPSILEACTVATVRPMERDPGAGRRRRRLPARDRRGARRGRPGPDEAQEGVAAQMAGGFLDLAVRMPAGRASGSTCASATSTTRPTATCATSARSCCWRTRSPLGGPRAGCSSSSTRRSRRRRSRRSPRSRSTSRCGTGPARGHALHRRLPARVAGHRCAP